jgi:two-component system, OmpR family, sensor kinase
MGRLFWKFFFFFWLAQIVTSFGVGIAIWARHPDHPDFRAPGHHAPPEGWPPPPPDWLGDRPPPPPPGGWADGRPPPPPPPHSLFPPLLPILAGSVVSLLFAALLAWYFARPIRSLRDAFDDVASGKLDTRIGTAMNKRRDELADLGGNFDRMAERLQNLIESQRRLLHDVSHELRSPLARLQAAADLMRQQPERAQEFVARIERDTERMDRLVGELLTLARLDAGMGDTPRETIDLTSLIEEIVEDARVEAETRACRIELAPTVAATVTGNPDLLRRALENVLRNALRHSPSGSCVTVSMRVATGFANIAIADAGEGVAENDLEAIFEPFYRAGNTDAFAGYGLGLAITRRVMQVHGGTVQAQNRPGSGLVVTLSLPEKR